MRDTTVLRAQEELDKFLEIWCRKNIDPLDLIFFGGLTLLQMEISMLQVIRGNRFQYVLGSEASGMQYHRGPPKYVPDKVRFPKIFAVFEILKSAH